MSEIFVQRTFETLPTHQGARGITPSKAQDMFDDLYDEISRLWSWSWPCAEGKVTEVLGEHIEYRSNEKRARLAVAYEFSVGADGPYTGECFWTPVFFSVSRVAGARRKVHRNQRVRVRYRPDDQA